MTDELAISWSQIRTHAECRQKSYLIRQRRSSAAKDLRSYYHGMVVDRVMRWWLDDPNHPPGVMPTMVDEAIDIGRVEAAENGDGVVRWKHAADRSELRAFCVELLNRLEPQLHEHVLPYAYVCGKRFRCPITIPHLDGSPTTIYLHGEMDLFVDRGPDGFVVLDLKGTRDDTYYRKVMGQLVFYDLAVLAEYGTPTTSVGLLQPMCAEPVLTWAVSNDARTYMWSRIQRLAEDIWRDNRDCKPTTAGCTWCDVKHACARYSPDDTATDLATGLRQAAAQMMEVPR